MKFISIATLLTIMWLYSCTETQLRESRIAEQHYLDLIYSLEQGNAVAAFEATESLHIQLDRLRSDWRRPMSKANTQRCRNHLDEAENAFTDVRELLKSHKLDGAKIQLDRAMSELYAADYDAFIQLYTGQIYDFYTTWKEAELIVNDQMLCLMEWKEYAWWANQARAEWQRIDCTTPNSDIYHFDTQTKQQFLAARDELGNKLDDFARNISRGDQCISQEYATAVSTALWALIQTIRETPSSANPKIKH